MGLLFEIKELILICVSFMISLLLLIVQKIKNSQTKKQASKKADVFNLVKEFMCEVELLKGFSGKDKKEWVKTRILNFCIKNNVDFTEEDMDKLIEHYIEISKLVNQREKDGLL